MMEDLKHHLSNFWVLIGCGKFVCFIKHRLKCEAKSFASLVMQKSLLKFVQIFGKIF